MSSSVSSSPSINSQDPFLSILGFFNKVDKLLPSSHEGVPDSVAIDEPLKFLCSLRTIRDTARKEVSSISQELEFARGVAKYQDLRLSMAKSKLTALEEIIGEMRMRCRMRGLPLYPPHTLLPVDPDEEDVDPSSEIADPSGPAITSDSGMMEEDCRV